MITSLHVPPLAEVTSVAALLAQIESIGVDKLRGGYSRPVFGTAEMELREWFVSHAQARGLDVEVDGTGTIRAWWHTPRGGPLSSSADESSGHSWNDLSGAVLTGSHLDSVPGGGAFDGPLGIASAFVAIDLLRARGVRPIRPLGVIAFPEEEGSRFGVACLGSRLLSGAIAPEHALALRDGDGTTFAEALARNGFDPRSARSDPAFLASLDCFVELHIEQGRGLADLDQPVAIGSSILGHGRWHVTLCGEGNHAGTTLMADRHDPMVAAARLIHEIRSIARRSPDARATVGRLEPTPGGTNVIASRVDFWVDVRHPQDDVTRALVEQIGLAMHAFAGEEGCTARLTGESFSATSHFDGGLRRTLEELLPAAPVLATGAGHDAGVLSAQLPTAMLFVRNPTGISHSPQEYATDLDVQLGAEALADTLAALLTRPRERDA